MLLTRGLCACTVSSWLAVEHGRLPHISVTAGEESIADRLHRYRCAAAHLQLQHSSYLLELECNKFDTVLRLTNHCSEAWFGHDPGNIAAFAMLARVLYRCLQPTTAAA